MIAKELHPLIRPAIHQKFSHNLHAWVKRQASSVLPLVATKPNTPMEAVYVGHFYADGWMRGARLIGVLSNGDKEKFWALQLPRAPFEFDTTFWERYLLDGRCAIDPEHHIGFIDQDTRWKTHGRIRECQWCGHHVQTKLDWTESVHKSEWVPA